MLVGENGMLADLDGLQFLTSVLGTILIDNNDALTNLDALDGLVDFGGDWLFIRENANVPTCEATMLRDLVQGFGWGGDVCIQNNLADTCEDDISGCL